MNRDWCIENDFSAQRELIENNYNSLINKFEVAAEKKGYSLDKDELGRYEDNWLQEAWEIFMMVPL